MKCGNKLKRTHSKNNNNTYNAKIYEKKKSERAKEREKKLVAYKSRTLVFAAKKSTKN